RRRGRRRRPSAADDGRRRGVPRDRGAHVRRPLPGGRRRRARSSGASGMSGSRSENRRSRFGTGWRGGRGRQAGFPLGSPLGAAATVLGRRAERIARRGLVDWGTVERVAIRRAEKAPGRLSALELRAADGAYREAMARVVPRLGEALGTPLPG